MKLQHLLELINELSPNTYLSIFAVMNSVNI